MRILIVDDEELARARIRDLLSGLESVECVGEAGNGIEAVERIRELSPDVVILDIQMPGLDGFGVVEALDEVPLIIFATAYNEYAIRAFEVNSIDYLLKPIEMERLQGAIGRARSILDSQVGLSTRIDQLAELVRSRGVERLPGAKGRKIVLLNLDDVVWIEASEELVFAHTVCEKYLVNLTMTELERRLNQHGFFRIHRSTIVNLSHVLEIAPWFSGKYRVTVDDEARTELVLSRSRVNDLRRILPW